MDPAEMLKNSFFQTYDNYRCQQMYIRVYLLTSSFCTAKTSLLFYFPSIRGRSDTLRIFRSNILLLQILLLHGNTAFENKLSVSLLQIGGADARSVQKTPTGVLIVRRGLFFVKRQRRCPHICKRKGWHKICL